MLEQDHRIAARRLGRCFSWGLTAALFPTARAISTWLGNEMDVVSFLVCETLRHLTMSYYHSRKSLHIVVIGPRIRSTDGSYCRLAYKGRMYNGRGLWVQWQIRIDLGCRHRLNIDCIMPPVSWWLGCRAVGSEHGLWLRCEHCCDRGLFCLCSGCRSACGCMCGCGCRIGPLSMIFLLLLGR